MFFSQFMTLSKCLPPLLELGASACVNGISRALNVYSPMENGPREAASSNPDGVQKRRRQATFVFGANFPISQNTSIKSVPSPSIVEETFFSK